MPLKILPPYLHSITASPPITTTVAIIEAFSAITEATSPSMFWIATNMLFMISAIV